MAFIGFIYALRIVALLFFLFPALAERSAVAGELTAATLTGTVTDESGNRVSAEVHAYLIQTLLGRPSLRPECIIHTDRNGRYVCTKLTSGAYVIGIRPDHSSTQKTDAALFFYPSGGHLSSAEIVIIQPGEYSTIDLHAASGPTGSIAMHGLSSTELHYSLSMSAIGLQLLLPTDCERSSSTHACTFRELPVGDYQIETSSEQDGKSVKSYQRVSVTPYAHLSVSANAPSGTHVTGTVSLNRLATTNKLSIALRSLDSMASYSNVAVDGEGKFSADSVQPGQYAVGINAGGDSYVCGTESGGVSHEGAVLSVPAGATNWQVNVALCPKAVTITGRLAELTDQKTKVRVVVIEVDTGVGYETDTDSGRFTFSGLAPGTYVVAAWPQSRAVAYANFSVQERLVKLGSHVTIEDAGDIETVDVPLLEGTAPLL